jgi:class 3 adenylate cyclase
MTVCASCGAENRDEARFCDSCGASLAPAPAREARKTVTVLFSDVTGSTALGERIDPESLRTVMARYFETAKTAIERHGGTVEKFIGDAVMAVFGVPVVHEDDALRAVRAADELRSALGPLNDELELRFQTRLEVRIGINTGEVVTGTEERLATGDAVNVAARLEQAARPGEILLGDETLRLVRGAVTGASLAPVAAKGKTEPLPAFRLDAVESEPAGDRRHTAPMVGRERQRRLLDEALANVVADRSCQLFTVLGMAGVGKSRLVAEFLAGLDEATIVSGRCLSYGEGISYFPVTEVAFQLGADAAEHPGLAPILGDSAATSSPDEIAWAFRKLLEARAGERPLVAVFDDLHWGEPTFLDLVEHVADFSRDAPILLLCMARPELLDRRETWGGGKLNATNVLLEPLQPAEADELLASLLPAALDAGLRERILVAADGNPLFVEEMVSMVAELDEADAEIAVPPTIQALLAARLDQLDLHERVVLERGSVEGLVFHRGVVEALAPAEPDVGRRLMSLVRKELVRPDRGLLAGDDAFRFRHLLIRDAAYEALPKAERADLHESFAHWLDGHAPELIELDELVGYHLEQAWRYRSELGATPEPELARAAHDRLAAAARRSLYRNDMRTAAKLLERAHLLAGDDVDLEVEIDRIRALVYAGEGDAAMTAARALAESAAAAGDGRARLAGELEELRAAAFFEPEGVLDRLASITDDALADLAGSGDDLALYLVHDARAAAFHIRGLSDHQLAAATEAFDAAHRLGLAHYEYWSLPYVISGKLHGWTPVSELISAIEEREAEGFKHPVLTITRAMALALVGEFDTARSVITALEEDLAQRGARIQLGNALFCRGDVETIAGDRVAAVEQRQRADAVFAELGERSWRSTIVALMADDYYGLDDLEQAWASTSRRR